MVVFFIEESNKFKFFKKFDIEKDKIILNRKTEKINDRLMYNVLRILKNNNCRNIIISKELKNNKKFLNYMYSNNIKIIQGKMLFKLLIEDFINKICKAIEINSKECRIAFTINYMDYNIIQVIENLSKEFKMISIVTNNLSLFKELKEKLYNESGFIISLTNNKRKALLRCNMIVNVDFPEEILNKYQIYDNAIIINLEEPVNIHKKRFSGKIINDYKILLKENSNIASELQKDKYDKYDLKDLAELFVMKYPEEIKNLIIVDF